MNVSNGSGRSRRTRGTYTTKSGKTMKINQSLGDRRKARKADRAAAKAAYLSTLPKSRFKRAPLSFTPQTGYSNTGLAGRDGIMALKISG